MAAVQAGDVLFLKSVLGDGSDRYLFADGVVDSALGLRGADADARACLFRVVFKLNYDARRPGAHLLRRRSSSSSPNLLAGARDGQRRRERESEAQAADMLARFGEPVRFGNVVQLQHVKTGKFVTLDPHGVAAVEKDCLRVYLSQEGNEGSWFVVAPRFKTRSTGGSVFVGDQVQFVSAKLPDHHLHVTDDGSSFAGDEVNLSEATTGWKVALYQEHAANSGRFLQVGQVVRLFHTEADAFLSHSADKLKEAAVPYLRLSVDGQPLHPDNYSAKSLWRVELPSAQAGGTVVWHGQQYRFRHVVTGKYLAVAPAPSLLSRRVRVAASAIAAFVSAGRARSSAALDEVADAAVEEEGDSSDHEQEPEPAQGQGQGQGQGQDQDDQLVHEDYYPAELTEHPTERTLFTLCPSTAATSDERVAIDDVLILNLQGTTPTGAPCWLHTTMAPKRDERDERDQRDERDERDEREAGDNYWRSATKTKRGLTIGFATHRFDEDAFTVYPAADADVADVELVLAHVPEVHRWCAQLAASASATGAGGGPGEIPDMRATLEEAIFFVTDTEDLEALECRGQPVPARQTLMRELKLVDALFWALSVPAVVAIPLNEISQPRFRGLLDTLRLVYKLVTQSFEGNTRNQLYIASQRMHCASCGCFARTPRAQAASFAHFRGRAASASAGCAGIAWMQLMIDGLSYALGAGACLRALVRDNKLLLDSKIDQAIVDKFVNVIAEIGPLPHYLGFLSALASCNGKGISAMQDGLLRVMLSEGNCGPERQRNRRRLIVETAMSPPRADRRFVSASDREFVESLLRRREWKDDKGRDFALLVYAQPDDKRPAEPERIKWFRKAWPEAKIPVVPDDVIPVLRGELKGYLRRHRDVFLYKGEGLMGKPLVAEGTRDIVVSWHASDLWFAGLDALFFSPVTFGMPLVPDVETPAHLSAYLATLGDAAPPGPTADQDDDDGLAAVRAALVPLLQGTSKQFVSVDDVFSHLDLNGDRLIAADELQQALAPFGVPAAQARRVFAALDANGDGSVDPAELVAALSRPAPALQWVSLEQLCWVMDPERLCYAVTGEPWAPATRAHRRLFDEHLQLARYYKAQIDLFADMCRSRSYNCIALLERHFPFLLLVTAMNNERLPDELRASFTTLTIMLYVVRFPHVPVQVPETVRCFRDVSAASSSNLLAFNYQPTPEEQADGFLRFPSASKFHLLRAFVADTFLGPMHGSGAHGDGRNQLVAAALQMLQKLTTLGFYAHKPSVRKLCLPLLAALDGRRGSGSGSGSARADDDALPGEIRRYQLTDDSRLVMQAKRSMVRVLLYFADTIVDVRLSELLFRFKQAEERGEALLTTGAMRAPLPDSSGRGGLRATMATLGSMGASARGTMVGGGFEMTALDNPLHHHRRQHTLAAGFAELVEEQGEEMGELTAGALRQFWRIFGEDDPAAQIRLDVMADGQLVPVLLDLMMYESPDVFESAVKLLVKHHSQKAAVIEAAQELQLLRSEWHSAEYGTLKAMLSVLRHDLQSLAVWSGAEEFGCYDPRAHGRVMDALDRLHDMCARDSQGVNQDLLRGLHAHDVLMTALQIQVDPAGQGQGQGQGRGQDMAVAIKKQAFAVAARFVRGNKTNQELLFRFVPEFMGLLGRGLGVVHTVANVFADNRNLCMQAPKSLVWELAHEVNRKAGGIAHLRCFQTLLFAQGYPLKRNQDMVLRVVTDPQFSRVCQLLSGEELQALAGWYSAHQSQESEDGDGGEPEVKQPEENEEDDDEDGLRDGPTATFEADVHRLYRRLKARAHPDADKARALAYHAQLIELLSCVAVGKHTRAEAKCQHLVPLELVLDVLLEPGMPLGVQTAYARFALQVFFDTKIQVRGVFENARTAALLRRFADALRAFAAGAASRDAAAFVLHGVLPALDGFRKNVFVRHQRAEVDGVLSECGSAADAVARSAFASSRVRRLARHVQTGLVEAMLGMGHISLGSSSGVGSSSVAPQPQGHGHGRRAAVSNRGAGGGGLEPFVKYVMALQSSPELQQAVASDFRAMVDAVRNVEALTDPALEPRGSARRANTITFADLASRMIDHVRYNLATHDPQVHVDVLAILRELVDYGTAHSSGGGSSSSSSSSTSTSAEQWEEREAERVSAGVLQMQELMNALGASELVVDIVSRDQSDRMVRAAVDLGIALLEGGNADVQRAMLRHLKRERNDRFFQVLHRRLVAARSNVKSARRKMKEEEAEEEERQAAAAGSGSGQAGQGAAGSGSGQPAAQPKQRPHSTSVRMKRSGISLARLLALDEDTQTVELELALLRFLQLLCEGHYHDMQEFLRKQVDNRQSFNVIDDVVQLVLTIAKDEATLTYYVKELQVTQLCLAFEFLIEAMQGPCTGNQQAVASSLVLEAGERIIRTTFPGELWGEHELASGRTRLHNTDECALSIDDIKHLKTRAAKTIFTVVEGRTDLAMHTLLVAKLDMSVIKRRMVALYYQFSALQALPPAEALRLGTTHPSWDEEYLAEGFDLLTLISVLALAFPRVRESITPRLDLPAKQLAQAQRRYQRLRAALVAEDAEYVRIMGPAAAAEAPGGGHGHGGHGGHGHVHHHGRASSVALSQMRRRGQSVQKQRGFSRLGEDGPSPSSFEREHLMSLSSATTHRRASTGLPGAAVLPSGSSGGGGGGTPADGWPARTSEVLQQGISFLSFFRQPTDAFANMLRARVMDRDVLAQLGAQCESVARQLQYGQVFAFFNARIGSIEIVWHGTLHRLYFQKPSQCAYLDAGTKRQLMRVLNIASREDKVQDFMSRTTELHFLMLHEERLAQIPVVARLVRRQVTLRRLSFATATVMNFVFLISLERSSTYASGLEFVPAVFGPLTQAMGLVQCLMAVLLLFCELVKRAPLVWRMARRRQAFPSELRSRPRVMRLLLVLARFVGVLVAGFALSAALWVRFDFTGGFPATAAVAVPLLLRDVRREAGSEPAARRAASVYACVYDVFAEPAVAFRVAYLLTALLGQTLLPYFFVFHLFDVVLISETLQNVVRAVTAPARQLLMSALLAAFIVYLFAVVAFARYQSQFSEAGGEQLYDYNQCKSLYVCTVTMLHMGLISGGGIGEYLSFELGRVPIEGVDADYLWRQIYDLLFFVMVTVVFLNIVFGIIVDTFSFLREAMSARRAYFDNFCYICNLSRQKLDSHAAKRGRSGGYRAHIKFEHNLWSYLYFCVYLYSKDPCEYNGAESYVKDALDRDLTTWIPNEDTLSLSGGLGSATPAAGGPPAGLPAPLADGELAERMEALEKQVAGVAGMLRELTASSLKSASSTASGLVAAFPGPGAGPGPEQSPARPRAETAML